MKLFELLKVLTNKDMSGICGESGIKIDVQNLNLTSSSDKYAKPFYTHDKFT